jgi:LuxR family transcriptional regulator, maltose regulon positive regulatory protein
MSASARSEEALAEQHAGPDSVAAALPLSLLASIRYQQGRIDEAEGMVFDRLPILSTTAMLDCVLARTSCWCASLHSG